MDRSGQRSLHPLLLQRSYWRNRLQELKLRKTSVLILPRPDLSGPFLEAEEFRARSHDGIRLWGLKGRPRLREDIVSIRVRTIGPCDLPDIDPAAVEEGFVEYVLQEPAGRRLEDRVLDVLRVAQIASDQEGLPLAQVVFFAPERERSAPDELRIAARILAENVEG
jgi:hypothetical protein